MTTRLERTCHGRYWSACWMANGKRKHRNLGRTDRMSERAAREAMEALIGTHAIHPATRTAETGTKLSAWCERYERLRSDLQPGSLDLVRRTCVLLREHFAADPRLDRITAPDAQDFRLWLEQRTGRREVELSAATVACHLRNARAIFNAAISEGRLGANPFSGVRPIRQHAPRGFHEVTLEEFDRLMDVLPDHHWRCFVALMRLAGLRSGIRGGEALGLEWSAVDWTRHMLTVVDQKRHRIRTVPIQEELYAILLAAHEAAEPGQVLACPLARTGLDRRLRKYIRLAGIDPYPKPAHSLRKSLESQWLAEFPVPAVTAWLGNSPRVAQTHYWQPTADLLASVTGLTRTEVKRQIKDARPTMPPVASIPMPTSATSLC